MYRPLWVVSGVFLGAPWALPLAAQPAVGEEAVPETSSTAPAGPQAASPAPVSVPDEPGSALPAGEVAAAEDADQAAALAAWGDVANVEAQAPVFEGKVYGFIDAYFEKVADTPARDPDDPARTIYEENPYEFDVLNANVMVQGAIYGRYRFFLNLAAPGSGSPAADEFLGIRNAWVEAPLVPGYLNVRAGKTYRRFGLYNEILDAVPTFIGIEPPELFDPDHLMVTRTTNLMLFGTAPLGASVLNYAVTTGNDERTGGAIPFGLDVYADIGTWLRLGTSFYTTGGDAAPTYAVGEGPPRGGVINWMEKDSFFVFGGYAQVQHESGLIVQVEYWQAEHDGTRDPAALQLLAEDGSLTDIQMERFFVSGDPDAGGILPAEYTVRTAYLRLGYEFPFGQRASLTPYLQADYYSNPETIAEKSLGGDAEAGISDDGRFQKYTVGAVFRPVSQVALKLDTSAHVQEFNDSTEFYPEVRVSFSYLWGLQ